MIDNSTMKAGQTGDEAPRIEVHLKPDYMRKYLSMGLRRTRDRAATLLADLLKAVDESEPDIEKIRQMAEGIRFESELRREFVAALFDMEPGPCLR